MGNEKKISYLRSFFRDEFAKGLWIGLSSANFSSLLTGVHLSEVKSIGKMRICSVGTGCLTIAKANIEERQYALCGLATAFTRIRPEAPWKEGNTPRE
jgi:hypothetical protein